MQLMSRNSVPAAYPAAAAYFLVFRCCCANSLHPFALDFFLSSLPEIHPPVHIACATAILRRCSLLIHVPAPLYPHACFHATLSVPFCPHVSANLFLMFHACMPARRQLLLLTKYKPVCAKLTAQDTSSAVLAVSQQCRESCKLWLLSCGVDQRRLVLGAGTPAHGLWRNIRHRASHKSTKEILANIRLLRRRRRRRPNLHRLLLPMLREVGRQRGSAACCVNVGAGGCRGRLHAVPRCWRRRHGPLPRA